MNSNETSFQLNNAFRFQWENAQQCYVLLYPEGLIKLSESAAEILKRCIDPVTETRLIENLLQAFHDAEDLPNDVREFLKDAREQGWITNVEQ